MLLIGLTSNVAINVNVLCPVEEHWIGGNNDHTLVITLHGNQSEYGDVEVMKEVT